MKNIRLITIVALLVLSFNVYTQTMTIDGTIDYLNITFNENKSPVVDDPATHNFKITDYGLLTYTRFWYNEVSYTVSAYIKNIDTAVVVESGGAIQLICDYSKCFKNINYYNNTKTEYNIDFISILFNGNKEDVTTKLINAFDHLIKLGKENPNYITSDPFYK